MITLTKLLIDNVDYSEYAVWTFQGQDTLNESLDLNYIELKGTDIENPFTPFLDVEIQIKDASGTTTINKFIESDTVTKIISNNTYNHNLLFIEETNARLFAVSSTQAGKNPLLQAQRTDLMFDQAAQ